MSRLIRKTTRLVWGAALLASRVVPQALAAQWQIGSGAGDTLRLGVLAQPRAEWVAHGQAMGTAQNLFMRHLRLLVAGKLHHNLDFFLGTDTPDLGKAQSDGTKNSGGVGIYDFWLTYSPSDAAKLDAGLIGTPNSHNSIQTISGMLAPEFGPYSFLSSPPTASRAGRDYGIQARGYLAHGHLEYRAAAFQGFRGPNADHELRYAGRVVVDAFTAEKAVYYSGTSLGTRRNLALGAGWDHQERYNSYGADVYADQPLANGDAVTVQADWVHYDGGSTFPTFPRQHTTLVEVGYLVSRMNVSPFLQIARNDHPGLSDTHQEQQLAGVAYWINGHRLNVKATYARIARSGAHAARQLQLTVQCLEF